MPSEVESIWSATNFAHAEAETCRVAAVAVRSAFFASSLRPLQVAHGLGFGFRDFDFDQLAGLVKLGQFLGVAAIGFDPLARLHGNQRRSHDDAADARGVEPPGEIVAGGTGFVADPQPIFVAKAIERFHELHPIVEHSSHHLGRLPFGCHRDNDGILMYIQPGNGSHSGVCR